MPLTSLQLWLAKTLFGFNNDVAKLALSPIRDSGSLSVSTLMLFFSLQVWFEGGYSEYDADLRKRTGGDPTRIKYRKMAVLA